MKRFLIFSLFIIFIFCSCGKADTEKYKSAYTADFEMEYRDYILKGKVSREESGISQMTLTDPESLEGLEIIHENGTVIITYKDIVLNADAESSIESSFANLTFEVLDKIAYSSDKCTVSKDKIEGKTENGDFEVTISPDGSIKSLTVPDSTLKADFTNFTFTEK